MNPRKIVYKHDYPWLIGNIKEKTQSAQMDAFRDLCKNDIYFLLRYACNVPPSVTEKWFFVERCKVADERQASPTGMDGWMIMLFREGFKSLVFNCGVNIQKILKDQEETSCIFSYKKGAAMDHLRTIKSIFEDSEQLKSWFPDIFYDNPNDYKQWSLDNGLVLKRRGNPKEPTISAGGIVEGQPIGKHYNNLCFDDVVTKDSVATPTMIDKTTETFELAENLGKNLEGEHCEKWTLGTHYKHGDTYCQMKEKTVEGKKVYKVETIECRDENGIPYAHTEEQLAKLYAKMGRYNYNCQMNLNPTPDEERRIKWEWVSFYDDLPKSKLRYMLLCDPAHTEKSKRNHDPDYTSMWVLACDGYGYLYFVDGVYDRIKATDAVKKAFELIREYDIRYVSWEQVGAQADTQFINHMKVDTGLNFKLNEFSPRKHGEKQSRIEGALLSPIESGRLKFPRRCHYRQADGQRVCLVNDVLKKELKEFPHAMGRAGSHDDFLDTGGQLLDAPKYGKLPKAKAETDPYAGYSEELRPNGFKNKKKKKSKRGYWKQYV